MGTRVPQSRSCVSLELKLGRRGILEPLTRRSKLNYENRKEVTEPALQQVRLGLYNFPHIAHHDSQVIQTVFFANIRPSIFPAPKNIISCR